MRIEEYQELAMRTSEEGHSRVLNGCMGLIGESGEIVDLIKKWRFQSGEQAELPVEKLLEECGDVLWYCAELCTGFNENLASIYNEKKHFFDDMEVINHNSPIELTVMRLAAIAGRPSMYLFDGIPGDDIDKLYLTASVKADIVGIMSIVRDILKAHCSANITDAMENNIKKLIKRYPDGFDAERSLHREQQEDGPTSWERDIIG